MKKILFTLAALCAFGIASADQQPQSQPAPDMGYRIDGELVSEITLAPGESQEVNITIERMYITMVSGMQAQWRMFDVDHNNINYDETGKVAPGKVYGSRVKTWFEGIEAGTSNAEVGGFDGVSIGTVMPYENVYRIMATNTKYNMCFFRYDENDNELFAQNIGHFTMVASPDWNEEYATFELDVNYTLWNQCPGYDPQVFEEAFYPEGYTLILKVKNANFAPSQDEVADPVITFAGEESTTMTVSVTCETADATLVVNGVEINGNSYSYTVTRDDVYTPGTVSCTAVSKKGTAQSDPVTASQDWVVADPLPAIVPQIAFNVVADGVYIVVTDATSYEVIVNGVNKGQIDYVPAAYYSQMIEVNAVNETPGHVKGEASDEYELGALMKQPVEAPVITTTMDDDYVYVHIQWPAETDGVRVYTGQYQYERGEYDYEVAVTAYVREGSQWQASPETHYVVEVPSNWKVYETPDPTVATQLTADQMIITATGEGTVTLYVTIYDETGSTVNHTITGEGTATYTINRCNEDIVISYYATALADVEGYDEVMPGISRSEYDVVPKKEQVTPPTTVGQPTFQGYTIDGLTGYGVSIYPSIPADASIKYRVLVWDRDAEEWVVSKDWTDYTGTEGEIWFENNGERVRIEAYAYVGDVQSDVAAYEFTVQTALDELMAGKTVAGVRYFNLAGQEMQEANGMTIVVTTYTDGTSSAVKVMK